MLLKVLLTNTKNKSSSGKKHSKLILLHSWTKEKIQERKSTRESMLMEMKKKMRHSNGWQIRF
jgi:hypothetical protein